MSFSPTDLSKQACLGSHWPDLLPPRSVQGSMSFKIRPTHLLFSFWDTDVVKQQHWGAMMSLWQLINVTVMPLSSRDTIMTVHCFGNARASNVIYSPSHLSLLVPLLLCQSCWFRSCGEALKSRAETLTLTASAAQLMRRMQWSSSEMPERRCHVRKSIHTYSSQSHITTIIMYVMVREQE